MPEVGVMQPVAQKLKIFMIFNCFGFGQVFLYQFFGHYVCITKLLNPPSLSGFC